MSILYDFVIQIYSLDAKLQTRLKNQMKKDTYIVCSTSINYLFFILCRLKSSEVTVFKKKKIGCSLRKGKFSHNLFHNKMQV